MGVKRLIRKIAKFILTSQPETATYVNISQINYGGILNNKNIVITGGSKGLGFEMAKKFLHEGARIVISGRNEATLKKAVSELGNGVQYIVSDVSKVEYVGPFLKKCEDLFEGSIDCLVSNAGISLHENNFENVTVEGFDKQFNTNFRGSYFLAQSYLKMKLSEENSSGQLLFISSETGDQMYDIPYGLTKAALNSLTGALSRRVYRSGIRVNAIAPGVTLSDMTKDYAEPLNGNLSRNCASGRLFLPEEIAEVACFLLSDASKCISGEVIHCNVGNHLKTFWDKVD
ncbi:SDR family NAD(P)-dependent oxidoreductase [Companilactobacillus insicii]|uniref:SDR family NAD(P)-dependent oxidoreductase n=1 Tax=Companilactobacillus insicii TaxID=1732567 RepID=UPI000F7808CF|nr:SDR family oxidoreductase [Companilactobacillus insicii]